MRSSTTPSTSDASALEPPLRRRDVHRPTDEHLGVVARDPGDGVSLGHVVERNDAGRCVARCDPVRSDRLTQHPHDHEQPARSSTRSSTATDTRTIGPTTSIGGAGRLARVGRGDHAADRRSGAAVAGRCRRDQFLDVGCGPGVVAVRLALHIVRRLASPRSTRRSHCSSGCSAAPPKRVWARGWTPSRATSTSRFRPRRRQT